MTISRTALAYWGLIALVILVFLTGGSARDDVSSLLVLRPAAMIALAAGGLALGASGWRDNRPILVVAALFPLLIALQLVPLPAALWHALPGRDLAAQIDLAAGLGSVWRPFSLVPYRTVNALLAWSVPLAALALALAMPRGRHAVIVAILLTLIGVCAVLGLLQVIGGTGNAFYLYRITNGDSAVGLFANRNHQAMALAMAFPFIAALTHLIPATAEQQVQRDWFAAGVAVLVVPFLLATQSRAGIGMGLVGLGLGWWTYRVPVSARESRRAKHKFDPRLLFAGLAVVCMALVTTIAMRSSSLQRLGSSGKADDELRMQVWGPIARLTAEYLPFGSGIGTFVEVYQVAEPDRLLSPNYLNHAHNDWLEWALTGGLPLVALVLVALVLGGRLALVQLRGKRGGNLALRRLGASVIVLLLAGSLYDYPLRVPSLAALFALATVWLIGRDPADVGAEPKIGSFGNT